RAPLRAMNNYATFLSDMYKEKLDEQGNSYLHRISSAAGRLDLLIRDVLNYTQLISAEVKLAPVDLDKLTREILATYPDWQAPKAQITLDGQLGCVLGHEGFLTQSIANLLSNAMKFVKAGVEPQIRIRGEAGKRPDTYRLWIEDNGIGIAAEDQKRIFGMFERIHSSEKYAGTGMGLMIVRKAVGRLGGEIGFESELGKGSRFWIELQGAKI
ncbi:MAG TPA: ATP-binding protein, partial [Candidatus Saccharimonadales bacterium]|nr:ATP-binding protein [Candidatus Saccharimonadales bacterium]